MVSQENVPAQWSDVPQATYNTDTLEHVMFAQTSLGTWLRFRGYTGHSCARPAKKTSIGSSLFQNCVSHHCNRQDANPCCLALRN